MPAPSTGFFVSLNAGREWKRFMNGLPTVRVDDVMVHPRDNDLILGTHGRSIWIMDDITALQQLSEATMNAEAHVFDVRPATAWMNDIQKAILVEGAKHFRGSNPPRGAAISYWLKSAPAGDVRVTISDVTGREFRTIEGTKEVGLNRVQWDLGLAGGRGARGARGGGGGQAGAAAPDAAAATTTAGQPTQPAQPLGGAVAAPTTTVGPEGQRGAAPTGQAAPAGQGAATGQAAQAGRGQGGGGRGGFGIPVPAGSYLVKVIVGDKVIGQKTVLVEADSIQ